MLFEYKKGFYIKASSLPKAVRKLRSKGIKFTRVVQVEPELCEKIQKKINRKKIEYKAFKNFLKEIALIQGKNKKYFLGKNKTKNIKKELSKLKKHLIA